MSTVTDEPIQKIRVKVATDGDTVTVGRVLEELSSILRDELERVLATKVSVEIEWINSLTAQTHPQNSLMAENWRWAMQAREAGTLNDYAGQHVVVHHNVVVAADRDAEVAVQMALRNTGALRRNLAVLFIDEPGKAGWLNVD